MAATAAPRGDLLEVGPLEISPDEHLARAQGTMLRLSIRELRLLTELARRLDRIVSREELYLLVWGRTMRSGDRSVDVYIRKLRVKLGGALPDWSFIHTHFGLGYRLSAEPTPQNRPVQPASHAGERGRSLSQQSDHASPPAPLADPRFTTG